MTYKISSSDVDWSLSEHTRIRMVLTYSVYHVFVTSKEDEDHETVHRMMCWTRDVTSLVTYPANDQPHIRPILTHWDLMTHIWSENCLAASCNVNHCLCINWTIGTFVRYLNHDFIIFFEEIQFEIVLCTTPICLSLDVLIEMSGAKWVLSSVTRCRYVACITKDYLTGVENARLLLVFIQGYPSQI